jgi:flavodoxin
MIETSFRSFFGQASDKIFLKEEQEGVLKHLTHLEELVLTSKKQGLDIAIQFLKELYEVLKGKTDSKTFVSIKIDGAPAVTAGINPENNNFFVGTKSIGNVNPKINYTDEDIDKNHGHAPGLVKKLKLALKYLPSVIKDGVYQGDFLFDQQDLKSQNIDGEDLILFKPNTITYAVEQHSAFGQRILNSKIGIIFHTKYSGHNLQNLKKSSDVSVSEFNQTQDVFVDDAKFKDISGLATFTKDESEKFETIIDSCETAGNRINWEQIPETIYTNLNIFINSLIRQGRFVQKPQDEYNNFVQWVNEKGMKAVDQLKTEKGKQKKQQALNEFVAAIEQNQKDVLNLFNLSKKLEQAKMMFVSKYNSAIKTKQFLTQPDGSLKVTAPEGYVAVDNLGNMTKFVDRLSFSAANFAISKGEKFK